MSNEGVFAYLGFSHFLGIGPIRFRQLCQAFQTVKNAYTAKEKDIADVIGGGIARKFVQFRAVFGAGKKLEEITKKQIKVLVQEDPLFPQALLHIPDPPICLYVKGELNSSTFSRNLLGIVGTRKVTAYGSYLARLFSSGLTQSGFSVVSGLAVGIDAVAHEECIKAGGKTIAFLGCGVDIVYPYANKKLYEDILKSGGLIVSEFPPGMTVLKGLFIARNRLISGISRGVLVVEGAKDSGALITARYAAEQGKDVFAPPQPITSEFSEGPNMLIKQGAKFVTCVQDILDEYDMKQIVNNSKQKTVTLSDEEKDICDALKNEPLSADELSLRLVKLVSTIMGIVSILEMNGILEKNQEGKYQIKSRH